MATAQTTIDRPVKHRRRRFRCSLRAMMLSVALVGVWLSTITYRAKRQMRAVATVAAAHGVVAYDYEVGENGDFVDRPEHLPGLDWLRNFIGIDYFATVREVHGVDGWFDADRTSILALADFRRLRTLSLSGSGVTDESIATVARLPELRQLSVIYAPLTDAGLRRLTALKELRVLNLNGDRITNAGLKYLKAFPKLEEVDLSETQISDAGLADLRALTQLKRFSAGETMMTQAGLQDLKSAISGLADADDGCCRCEPCGNAHYLYLGPFSDQ